MGGGVHHSAVDGHLRDIPAWFGPLVALTSVYLTGVDFADGGPSENANERSATLLNVTSRLAGIDLGSEPLSKPAW